MIFAKHNHADVHGTVLHDPPHTIAAPEMDPGVGFTAVLLLLGLLAVMTGRRKAREL